MTVDRNHKAIARMKALSCCILIPTYNNGGTLAKVISEVMNYSDDVIVINDGSTDNSDELLQSLKDIDYLCMPVNKGKGIVLKKGFRYAYKKGYKYVITIDSDGQHIAEDILNFIDKIERHPGALIVGARNMTVDNVPKKSSFGKKFSNFWFRFETGKKLPDTQSGFRLYPLDPTGKMKYFTGRYEFEIEVLVRCAWKGVKITSVPVKVWYAPREIRVSHFRPFIDFTRVSILNIFLVLISLILIKPFQFLQALNRKNIGEFFHKHVLAPGESNARKTVSVMVGVFLGIFPIWGWQIAAAIMISVFFKLNRMITIVSSNISIPPMIPVVIFGSYLIGGVFIKKDAIKLDYDSGITLEYITQNFLQYMVGATVLAFITALVCGLITYVLLTIFRKDVKGKSIELLVIKRKRHVKSQIPRR